MRNRIEETTVILISTFKWSILAAIIGAAVGVSTTVFLKLLDLGTFAAGQHARYYLILPAAMFLSAIIVKYLAPEAEGHGTEKVIEAVHKRSGRINPLVVPVKLAASIITIMFGGSAGKEGPCAQIGGGVSSFISDIFRFDSSDRKKLVICGISAGFASVFGTPFAGAIFGVEVLFIGGILYEVLLPSFIAGIVSYHVSSLLGITYLYHPIASAPVFSEMFLIKVIFAGVLFGLISLFFIDIMKIFSVISSKIKIWDPLRGLIGGSIIVALALIFSTQFLGLGLDTIQGALGGAEVLWYAFILKIIFTAITLSFGGSGGVITPIFFIGAASGAAFAGLLRMDSSLLASIGLVSVLAGATNTPLASSIMAIELFGADIAPYAALACIISFLVTGHRSIYPSQVLGIRKSSSIKVGVGKEISKAEPRFSPREKSLIGLGLSLFKVIRRKLRRRG